MRARVALLVFFATTGVARAAIYGYIDPGGVTHLATEALDDHYTLLLKTGNQPPDGGSPPAASDAALMKTRLFQRLVAHPNIAKYVLIRAASSRYGLDPELVKAVIAVESGFEPDAVSDKGAVGLMQILPATGERYGVRADRRRSVGAKLADPVLNREIGTRYLAGLRKQFVDRPDLVLAAYNAGENAMVRDRNTVPPFPETQAYVRLVDQSHAYDEPSRVLPGRIDPIDRIRVTVPAARRNMPDPNVPLRLPPPPTRSVPFASIAVPAAAAGPAP